MAFGYTRGVVSTHWVYLHLRAVALMGSVPPLELSCAHAFATVEQWRRGWTAGQTSPLVAVKPSLSDG
eukprot:3848708-Lingulodinium_polyedra.AAC.1